jgi:hypothetical protein
MEGLMAAQPTDSLGNVKSRRGNTAHASFDRLRMRKIENGISRMPQRKNLILSLSKDAPVVLHRRDIA